MESCTLVAWQNQALKELQQLKVKVEQGHSECIQVSAVDVIPQVMKSTTTVTNCSPAATKWLKISSLEIQFYVHMATLYNVEHFTLHGLGHGSLLPISAQDRNPSPSPSPAT